VPQQVPESLPGQVLEQVLEQVPGQWLEQEQWFAVRKVFLLEQTAARPAQGLSSGSKLPQ
jgi:hypothetical protein